MKHLFSLAGLLCLLMLTGAHAPTSLAPAPAPKFSLVIHGGAGYMRPDNLSPKDQEKYQLALTEALEHGYKILADGGSSVDAVEAVITTLEDNPLFNAGKGAVLDITGTVKMDASLMSGEDGQAGAVAGLSRTRHPIKAARLVMEESPHVMLSGDGADAYAEGAGLQTMASDWFVTERQKQSWQNAQKNKGNGYQAPANPMEGSSKFGTVGAVALDQQGNLAAGTSTGGMLNKQFGRIGDSPVIGAGTYANNKTCAVSCTGHGEFFIRNVVAYDVAALMQYRKLGLQQAADLVVQEKLKTKGGDGGLIAVDGNGNMVFSFNTSGMFRGSVNQEGLAQVFIFKNDKAYETKIGGNADLGR
ncbi:MAG: isoaspartyl peptidase/L-asparaginase family protein [Salibacteraceae bacterium]